MRTHAIHLALLSALVVVQAAAARTLSIGPTGDYSRLTQAATEALPGDTLLFLPGTYPGGESVSNLHGEPDRPVVISGGGEGLVTIMGGTESIHFSNVSWIRIEYLTVRKQTGNGMNIDDGGTFDSPSHHVVVADCRFREMDASGNNDLLKLSGLDTFIVERSTFERGASGGSGIDMVGCHIGRIEQNQFEQLGSNGIQAKGGTRGVQILRNRFIDCGERSVNLGGSTGLAFFRPQDAPFEAADLLVRANTFIGSRAPIAYVGSVRVRVENNTIWRPGNWALRILQETVDPTRFVEVGESVFSNNIVVVDSDLSRLVNIGPNTRPETFIFENNLFYHLDQSDPDWDELPGTVRGNIWNEDPFFADTLNFMPWPTSPAIGAGRTIPEPANDLLGRTFLSPPSIGAVEGGTSSGVAWNVEDDPEGTKLWYREGEIWVDTHQAVWRVALATTDGRLLVQRDIESGRTGSASAILQVEGIPSGLYFVSLTCGSGHVETFPVVIGGSAR